MSDFCSLYYPESLGLQLIVHLLVLQMVSSQLQQGIFNAQSLTLHTSVGDIKVELFCEQTPRTCHNFLALCASQYYDACLFHRNMQGFMIQ